MQKLQVFCTQGLGAADKQVVLVHCDASGKSLVYGKGKNFSLRRFHREFKFWKSLLLPKEKIKVKEICVDVDFSTGNTSLEKFKKMFGVSKNVE